MQLHKKYVFALCLACGAWSATAQTSQRALEDFMLRGADFEPILKLLSEAKYEGWLLVEAEQDPAKANPLEYAMKGRKYIAEHTGL